MIPTPFAPRKRLQQGNRLAEDSANPTPTKLLKSDRESTQETNATPKRSLITKLSIRKQTQLSHAITKPQQAKSSEIQPASKKRKSTGNNSIFAEVDDLDIHKIEHPVGKRRRTSTISRKHDVSEFEFLAVCYYEDGVPVGFQSDELHRDGMPGLYGRLCRELWDRTGKVMDKWEAVWGFELDEEIVDKTPCCITRLSEGKSTRWYPGCQAKYVCRDCHKKDRPCFTWTEDEYVLLPLRKEDRRKEPKKGEEARYWLNDEAKGGDDDDDDWNGGLA